jgi:hypothetical protein
MASFGGLRRGRYVIYPCVFFFLGHLGKRWIRERRMARGRGIITIIITKRKEADMRVQQQKASYTNSTEVLFAVVSFYQLRVIERLWGSRKFAVSFAYTDICSSLCLDSPTLCISSKKKASKLTTNNDDFHKNSPSSYQPYLIPRSYPRSS